MKTINYKIEFFSCWHCGSGLSAGADVDALVIKDKNGIPFIPGKTIKGLLREAVEEILYSGVEDAHSVDELIKESFGLFIDKNNFWKGSMFFTNAELSPSLQSKIQTVQLEKYLYTSIASTAIEENGIAKDFSLRKIQLVVPCELYGTIMNVPDNMEEILAKGLKFIKRVGVNRNRGLGRCSLSVIEKGVNL